MQFLKLSLVSVLSLTLLACGDDKKDSISDSEAEATAKEMVADARNFIAANDLQSVDESAQAFTAELEDSKMLASDEANQIYQLSFITAKAIQHAAEAEAETSFEENGITVSIDNGHYSVEQDYDGMTVTLVADLAVQYSADGDSYENETGTYETGEMSYEAVLENMSGAIAGEHLQLSITAGSLNSAVAEETSTNDNYLLDSYLETNHTDIDVNLELTASLKEINPEKENKITLNGDLTLNIKGFEEGILSSDSVSDTNQNQYYVESGSIAFSGQISDEIGNNIGVMIQAALKDISYYTQINYSNASSEDEFTIPGENAESDINVKLEANLAGIDKNAIIVLKQTATQTSSLLLINVQFQDKSLELKINAKQGENDTVKMSTTITHSNGAVLYININADKASNDIGYISVKGKKAASISRNSKGIYIVRYISGAFESLQ